MSAWSSWRGEHDLFVQVNPLARGAAGWANIWFLRLILSFKNQVRFALPEILGRLLYVGPYARCIYTSMMTPTSQMKKSMSYELPSSFSAPQWTLPHVCGLLWFCPSGPLIESTKWPPPCWASTKRQWYLHRGHTLCFVNILGNFLRVSQPLYEVQWRHGSQFTWVPWRLFKMAAPPASPWASPTVVYKEI